MYFVYDIHSITTQNRALLCLQIINITYYVLFVLLY